MWILKVIKSASLLLHCKSKAFFEFLILQFRLLLSCQFLVLSSYPLHHRAEFQVGCQKMILTCGYREVGSFSLI
ncbi:hypothetical protein K2173_011044 [Erythroxylum novogranatense]|uniref:Uncharacterized protein n=1 Tax=Erythroxylum novogranatense TaxID=1862640 RepID=A0AAV8T1P0_9ROSI|nr:hypothetical protein K2173_011044 [Erythroxylum novogranatense]